jgi:hypothetical protein
MNWDAIGAVGEMIGSLAVVVTLVYLALQVRTAKVESSSNAIAVEREVYLATRAQFVENADLWVKGNSGGELSASERFAFDELVSAKADQHFFWFARGVVSGNALDQQVAITDLALFFHRFPVAYACWGLDEARYVEMWRRLRMESAALGKEWYRRVREAVAALEGME